MSGLSEKEYNNQVDEALAMFGGGAPCVNVDPRQWALFKKQFQELNGYQPKTIDWSFDQVSDWLTGYDSVIEN